MALGAPRAYVLPVRRALSDLVHRHGDSLLAVGLVALLVIQVWTLSVSPTDQVVTTACGLAILVPLARRSRVPLVLLGVLLATAVVGHWLPKPVTDVEAYGFIVLVTLYSAGAHTTGRRAWIGGGAAVLFAVVALTEDPQGVYLGGVLFFTLLFGAPWLAGKVVQRRRTSEARMRHERDAAAAAIVEERARIARELHDVVAHAISVIVLQARGGRRLLDSEPEETRGALDTIEHTGQQALVEMRRLVGLLRESDEALELAPQPTLSQLDHLVAQVRAAGLPVEVAIEGEPVELPPGVDLSAYRIVQEALTNALKHAGPTRARITLDYGTDGLDVDVADDGVGAGNGGNGGNGGGYGLAGIRERVAVVGGDLDAGPRPGGGFAVHARLPYGRER
jgi:signal transduction histidine kinase